MKALFSILGTRASLVCAVLSALMALGVAPLACSSKTTCDDSKCAAGNKCVDTGTATQCELICNSQNVCPANYHCAAGTKDTAVNYCQPDGVKFSAKSTGQWGSHCNPTGGLDSNPDCDTDNQFWCYARNPTDDQAFCTQFQCSKDTDCGRDYVCATINTYPNAQTAKRKYGETTTACLPRTYCEPCATDIDCVGPTGIAASCVTGTDNVKFCTTACSNDGNCAQDATCDATGVCKPLAGVCKGDGSFCSPCRADTDCKNDGICATQNYSGERYCTQKSPTPCTVSNPSCKSPVAYCTAVNEDSAGNLIYGCTDVGGTTCDPKANVSHFGCPTTTVQNDPVSCSIDNANPALPQDMCYGLVTFGTGANANYVDGCWTKSSK